MSNEFLVLDLFRLTDATTVLACKSVGGSDVPIKGKTAKLVLGDRVHQSIVLTGERQMLNRSKAEDSELAVETKDAVNLSSDEARGGLWRLVID